MKYAMILIIILMTGCAKTKDVDYGILKTWTCNFTNLPNSKIIMQLNHLQIDVEGAFRETLCGLPPANDPASCSNLAILATIGSDRKIHLPEDTQSNPVTLARDLRYFLSDSSLVVTDDPSGQGWGDVNCH